MANTTDTPTLYPQIPELPSSRPGAPDRKETAAEGRTGAARLAESRSWNESRRGPRRHGPRHARKRDRRPSGHATAARARRPDRRRRCIPMVPPGRHAAAGPRTVAERATRRRPPARRKPNGRSSPWGRALDRPARPRVQTREPAYRPSTRRSSARRRAGSPSSSSARFQARPRIPEKCRNGANGHCQCHITLFQK
jgi:hypothetical protein